jgi:thioredoxin 1
VVASEITGATFGREVLDSEQDVLVDFWAPWCAPCRAMNPILERVVAERESSLKLVKVNIDEEVELAVRYGISSIPAVLLFRDGEPAAGAVGAMPQRTLERRLGLQAVASDHQRGEPAPRSLGRRLRSALRRS